MARVFTSGFELNSLTSGVEFNTTGGSPTFSTTTIRNGSRSGRISSLVSATAQFFRFQFAAATLNLSYHRFYLNIHTLPSAENTIFLLNNSGDFTSPAVYITVDNNGALRLYDEDGQVGSASTTLLSVDTWYRIGVKVDRSLTAGSQIVEGRINGAVFATASNRNIGQGVAHANWGGNLLAETQTVGDWFFDDIAINDSTGSFQNSYPASGGVIILRPSAAGDANDFASQTGGTVGAANNFTRVNEVTPDDATTYNGDNTLDRQDLFNLTDSGINPTDVINCVQVNFRFRNNTADATTAVKAQVEKVTGGTKVLSGAIIPNSTTWNTNATASPKFPAITLYKDPDNISFNKNTLDSMQAGYIISTGGTNRIDVTDLWIYVDYTPGAWTIFGDQQFVT